MNELRPASREDLNRVLTSEFAPEDLQIRRDHEGGLQVRILSTYFGESPMDEVETALRSQGLRLPDRTLVLAYSPDELGPEERAGLFRQGQLGTPTWADALAIESALAVLKDDRQLAGTRVVAFWGLKGGVGRTTTLAQVAGIIGRRVRVLAIDLDLDSPALAASLANSNGHVPRFEKLLELSADPSLSDDKLGHEISTAFRASVDQHARIDVLGPGYADDEYVANLLGILAPSMLYRGATPALRRLVRVAARASGAEFVFLDVRSGYCDESAMAVLDLADEVVLFASPAPSTFASLKPAIKAFSRNRHAIGRPERVHYVASMLPAGQEARQRVREELRVIIEEALAEGPADLPIETTEIDIVEIDYSPRVVENEGSMQYDAVSGFRELADRIAPPPVSIGLGAVEPSEVARILKEAQVPAAHAEGEANLETLAELFTSTASLETFLRQETLLVLGAKGTGKSFLQRMCLHHQDLLAQRSGMKALGNVIFVDGYSQPRGEYRAKPPFSNELLRTLDRSVDGDWRNIWSVIALARTLSRLSGQSNKLALPKGIALALEQLSGETSQTKISQRILKLAKKPLELEDSWGALANLCERESSRVVLLFDDLDLALGQDQQAARRRQNLVRGLIERSLETWVPRNLALGVKIFLREDIFRSLHLEDEAKFESRRVILNWQPDELWRLVIRTLATSSPTFKEMLNRRGVDLGRLEAVATEDRDSILEQIWGNRIGEANTRSKSWVYRRLRDAKDRIFPRSALWLLRSAIEERRRNLAKEPAAPLLDGPSLRKAMPYVARERLAELHAESSDREREIFQRLKGWKSFSTEDDFINYLQKAGESDPREALRALKDLGIVESGQRRDKTPSVRIVDLYAYAPDLEIKRVGQR